MSITEGLDVFRGAEIERCPGEWTEAGVWTCIDCDADCPEACMIDSDESDDRAYNARR
jgi:hypothetical protein